MINAKPDDQNENANIFVHNWERITISNDGKHEKYY